MKQKPDNSFQSELFRIKKQEEQLILEKLKEEYLKAKTVLSFKEWIMM